MVCSTTPRFSYDESKRRVRAVSTRMSDVYQRWCTGWVWYQGGYTGWVYGRVIPGTPSELESGGRYSEAGPEALQGLEWWYLLQRPPAVPGTTLRARSLRSLYQGRLPGQYPPTGQ